MIFSSLMALMASSSIPPMPEDLMSSEHMGVMGSILLGMFKYFDLVAYVQLVVAAIIVWAGVDLLRLRVWARAAIEVFCWLAMVFHALLAALWIWMCVTVFSEFQNIPDHDAIPFSIDGMMYAGIVIGVVVIAALTVPLVLVLRYLRGSEARAAVAGHLTQAAREGS